MSTSLVYGVSPGVGNLPCFYFYGYAITLWFKLLHSVAHKQQQKNKLCNQYAHFKHRTKIMDNISAIKAIDALPMNQHLHALVNKEIVHN